MNDTLYISLGSTCKIGHTLKDCGLRLRSYPFDWITTIDSEKFIDLIDTNFQFFLDKRYLHGVTKDPYPLLNIYYNIELLHEGRFDRKNFEQNIALLKEKYTRRIDRFRNLNNYDGKVVFLRHCYKNSISDLARVYHDEKNIEITEEYALRLNEKMKKLFNKLDFTLIIVNNHESSEVIEERRIGNVIMIRVNAHTDECADSGFLKQYLISQKY